MQQSIGKALIRRSCDYHSAIRNYYFHLLKMIKGLGRVSQETVYLGIPMKLIELCCTEHQIGVLVLAG